MLAINMSSIRLHSMGTIAHSLRGCFGLMLCALSSQLIAASGVTAGTDYEEVIVTAYHTPQPAQKVGATVTSIDIENEAGVIPADTADLLRNLPGISLNRTGPQGGLTQLRLRGAEANHTLVLIDGIEANDPSLGAEFNFALLGADQLARIEVLRGPQSARYGAESIGGVVALFTPTIDNDTREANVYAQGGSHNRRNYGTTMRFATEQGDFKAGFFGNRLTTDGYNISAFGNEKDGFKNTSLHGKLIKEWDSGFDAELTFRKVDARSDGDKQDFDFPSTATQGLVIDSGDVTETEQRYFRLALNRTGVRWSHNLAFTQTDSVTDFFSAQQLSSGSAGKRDQWTYQASIALNANGSQTIAKSYVNIGAQYEDLSFTNIYPSYADANYNAADSQQGLFAEYIYHGRRWHFATSVRHDNNDRFSDATTARATLNYQLDASATTHLHFSIGQGVANPTFFELFGFIPSAFQGNPDLKPESSQGWDIGITRNFFDATWRADVTYFQADLTDEIVTSYDSTTYLSTAVNQAGQSKREGVEVFLNAQVSERTNLIAAFTYLDTKDPDGRVEVRRPKHSARLALQRDVLDGRGQARLSWLRNGEQDDNEFIYATTEDRVTLSAYDILSVSVNLDLSDRFTWMLQAENVLDEEYVEVFGYRSPGRTFRVGVSATL